MPIIKIIAYISGLLIASITYAQDSEDPDASHLGRNIFAAHCAACHGNSEAARAPTLERLRQLNRSTIEYAINIGYMKLQAKNLNAEERVQLVEWLSLDQTDPNAWLAKAMCANDAAKIDKDAKPIATAFGLGPRNLRFQTAEQSGLKTSDFKNLELAWAVAFPQTPSMRSQPVVAGTTIFIATADAGRVFALDTNSGCVKWQYESPIPLRSSLSYGEIEKGKPVIVAGDTTGTVVAINALNGTQLWRRDIKLHESNRITGTPVVHKSRVFVPLSGVEINYTREDSYECCKAHGAVVALDLESGEKLWVGHTMPNATKRKLNRAGAQLWGPSGAPIWSSPAIDEKRNVLYVGTGENNSLPVTKTSDAIIAFDLDTGKQKWIFQATPKDAWNYACRGGANCDFGDEATVLDYDFGGSVMITQRKDGRDLLVVGQKSGIVWALDPDKDGELVWSRQLGRGSAMGGIHWGTATDGKLVFAPSNDRKPTEQRPDGDPGLHALDLETGEVVWSYDAVADCSGERNLRYPACDSRLGNSPAPIVVDGAVVQGSVDGMLRVFDAQSGEVLWHYNTMREFETINDVEGNGGSLDSSPYIAANGTLFVQSGYSRFGQAPGNVLLAFKPKK